MTLGFVQLATLGAAVVTTGLMAGLFFAFTTAVMPALKRSADRTFVETMNKINVDIVNGRFLLCFLGALALSFVAVLVHLPRDGRSALPWVIAGFLLYLAVIVLTRAMNIPLNDELAKTAETAPADALAAARARFEAAWVRWNLVRMLVNLGAFVSLVGALIAHARATP